MTDEVQSPFLPGTNIQVAWDSTSLGWLKVCPRLYYYQMIEGWASNEESVHLRFGQEYHHALQDYDVLRAAGIRHNDAVHDTVRELLIRTADFDPDHKTKTRSGLVRTVIWYLDQFRNENTKTHILADGKPAVELSFRFELDWGPASAKEQTWIDEDSGITGNKYKQTQPYILSGHLDRVIDLNGDLFVMDRKTTTAAPSSWFFSNSSPTIKCPSTPSQGRSLWGPPFGASSSTRPKSLKTKAASAEGSPTAPQRKPPNGSPTSAIGSPSQSNTPSTTTGR